MVNWLSNSSERSGFDKIHRMFQQMLDDGRHIFDAAANALVGGTDPAAIRNDLFDTDERINLTEQKIRRLIVVHGTVHGAPSFPSLLVMMSLVKDAERIGDYAKNIFDLAVRHPDLGGDYERSKLIELKDRISRLLARTLDVYASQDERGARALLAESDEIQDYCDSKLDSVLSSAEPHSAAIALTHRYFKRVSSHSANVATSLVMPLDKLDFFDED